MKIITWNVNSVSSRKERLLELLVRHNPDVVCLQELKCQEEKYPFEEIRALGYESVVYGQKTYNGVAILSRSPLNDVRKGFGPEILSEEDPAARLIAATVQGVRIVCVYCPNGQAVGTEKYSYKLTWFSNLKKYLHSYVSAPETFPSDFVVLGDFNVAPENRDIHDPSDWDGKVLASVPERQALGAILDIGLVDIFRKHHAEGGHYSWWDYRQLAFPFNKGLRIDLILASPSFEKRCTESFIDRDERKGSKPSDHAPVVAVFGET
jgi:exodeoxyribonuclease-3